MAFDNTRLNLVPKARRSAIPIPSRTCKELFKLSYCSTKTADLQAEHKYTTKANLCIRVPCFGIT